MGKIVVTIELTNTADALAVRSGYVEQSAIRRHTMPAVVDTGAVLLGFSSLFMDVLREIRIMVLPAREIADVAGVAYGDGPALVDIH